MPALIHPSQSLSTAAETRCRCSRSLWGIRGVRRFEPCQGGAPGAAPDPCKPAPVDHLNEVRQVLLARTGTRGNRQVAQLHGLTHHILHRRATTARKRGDGVNRKVTDAVPLYLPGNDRKGSDLGWRVAGADRDRNRRPIVPMTDRAREALADAYKGRLTT